MQIDETRFLPGPAVDRRYGIHRMTRWRWQRDEDLGFPKPITVRGRPMWRLADLEAWETARHAAA